MKNKTNKTREIKFRAWDTSDKKMVYEPTVWGEYEDYGDGESNSGEMPINKMFKRDYLIFMQFTCLKDKNGKEIYEGDIYKRPSIDKEIEIEEVENLQSFFESKGIEEEELGADYSEIEVIGNKFENPELVK